MNFLIFGVIILTEICSAGGCREQKGRIKELLRENRKLRSEREKLKAEKNRFCEDFDQIEEEEKEQSKAENEKTVTETENVPLVTVTSSSSENLNILVIPQIFDSSYLFKKDASTRAAKISAPSGRFTQNVKHALVNGQLHIFGGFHEFKRVIFIFE